MPSCVGAAGPVAAVAPPSSAESLKLTTIPRINGYAEVFHEVKLFGALAHIKLSLSELQRRRNLGEPIRIATTRALTKLSDARFRLDLEFLAVSQLSGILSFSVAVRL